MNNHSLSVTIDIEDWYHIPSVCGSPFSAYRDVDEFFKKWNDRYDYLSEPTKMVLDLLDEFDITATFFVVADVVEHYPRLVEGIIDRGHEIGCHGLHHSLKIHSKTKKALMSVEEFRERTLKAKKILEDICGEKVIGYRAPAAYVGGWMLDVLEDIGFKYDSSVCVNSLYNKTDSSLKGVSSYPYYPKKNSLGVGGERDFIEFPWAYWDVFGFKIPTSGGPMLRFLGAQVILKGLKQSLKRQTLRKFDQQTFKKSLTKNAVHATTREHTVFYFHPIDISYEKFPRVGKGRPFLWLIKGKIVEKRIRYILEILKDINKVSLKDAVGEML